MKFYVFLTLTFMLILQGGCIKNEKKDPYKQGELVTWKFNEELIIKTELGQRRKHIPLDPPRAEKEFYRPHLEHYVGQFPIDYQPKKYPTLSKQEAKQIEPYKRDVTNWLEFDLMLNGSWIEPADESIHSPRALDHEDQVKVRVNYLSANSKNTKQNFEENQMQHLDKNSEHELYGMKCYFYLNREKDELRKRCFTNSQNPIISGYSVMLFPKQVVVDYQEFSYGGIQIRYIVNPKNLDKIPQIDQAIWRLIDTWNVVKN